MIWWVADVKVDAVLELVPWLLYDPFGLLDTAWKVFRLGYFMREL